MAITIIKHGVVPKRLMSMMCSNCGCIFTCEQSDAKVTPPPLDGFVCACPTCGEPVVWGGLWVSDKRLR